MHLKSTAIAFCLLTACNGGTTNQIAGGAATAGIGGTLPTTGTAAVSGAAATAGATAGTIATVPTGVAGSSATAGTGGVPTAGTGGVPTAGVGTIAAGSGGTSLAVAGAGGVEDTDAGAPTSGAGGASGSTSAGAGGGAGAGGSAGGVPGCTGSTLLPVPTDTSARGPWPVGEKTVKFGRFTAVEVMYPATPGSEAGKDTIKYDLRVFLPASEQKKVPDAQASIADQTTYRDLPIDAAHGPYPVVIFVHGTASDRIGNFSSEALWASRGFVVMAADHPGLYLADYLGSNGCGAVVPAVNLSGDVDSEITALASPAGDLSFLADRIDMKRLGLSGHSAGAFNIAQFTTKPGVQIVMPLAGTHTANPSSTLKSVLFVGGITDSVLSFKSPQTGIGNLLYPGTDTDAYTASPGPPNVKKRLVGISNADHLNVTDLCEPNPQGKSDLDAAAAAGVCGVASVQMLAKCGTVDRVKAITIVNDATTAALEETLQCADRAATLSSLMKRYPDVGVFQEAVK